MIFTQKLLEDTKKKKKRTRNYFSLDQWGPGGFYNQSLFLLGTGIFLDLAEAGGILQLSCSHLRALNSHKSLGRRRLLDGALLSGAHECLTTQIITLEQFRGLT